MIISKELAQNIVDHLMNIVHKNVNIMDCNGIIIASGQPHRINTFHEGGSFAARSRKTVEIQSQEVRNYSGFLLPGVMWPITVKNKTVGAVSIAGEPDEVRNIAELVKTVTELVLEREMFLADYSSENKIKAQLVELLFSDNPDKHAEDIATLAGMLNYKLNLPRIVILLKLHTISNSDYKSDSLQNLFSARINETILSQLKNAAIVSDQDICLFYKQNLCLIKFWPGHWTTKKTTLFTTNIIQALNFVQPNLNIQIAFGSVAQQDAQLRHSYNEAMFALEYPNSNMTRSIHESEILLNYLLGKQAAIYPSCLALQEIKQKFDEMKNNDDMQKTLECLLINNLNISTTASQLFIHRNTLKFRLERFKRITGLEPCHDFQHAMLCQILLYTSKFSESK